MIEVHDITRKFGDLVAVDQVSFTIPGGAVCGFVGPNGAGKTTTLRILATLEQPSQGRVTFNRVDIAQHPSAARKLVGYMPDYCGSYPNLRGSDFLELFARAHGLHGAERARRVHELCDMLHLHDLLDRDVETLSKGQKQRFSLARALMHGPRILLLDEPAAGLDPRARRDLYAVLAQLARDGTTILVSSHILDELADAITWVVILHQGRVRYHGPVSAAAEVGGRGTAFVVEVRSPISAAAALFAVQLGVLQCDVLDEQRLRVRVDEHLQPLEDILARAIVGGARIRQVHQIRRPLDELFLTTTGSNDACPEPTPR